MSYKIEESVDYSDSKIQLGCQNYGNTYLIYDDVKKVFIAVRKLIKTDENWRLKMMEAVNNQKQYSHLAPFTTLLDLGPPPESDKEKHDHYLYYDFVCGGNLSDLIQQLRLANEQEWEEEEIQENAIVGWNLKQELIIAYGVARALQYIHNNEQNLKKFRPNDILLTHDLEPKVDILKYRPPIIGMGMTVDKNWIYDSPEAITNEQYPKQGSDRYVNYLDIYSWAMIMYEMITLKRPYEDYMNPDDEKSELRCKGQIITNSLRPKFPESFSHPLKEIIEKCWNQTPEERYTAEQACQKIHEVAQHVLEGEDLGAFEAYVKKVETPRDLDVYDGFHENIKKATKKNIANAYYISSELYKNGIYFEKNSEKAEQMKDQYEFLFNTQG